MIEVRNAAGDVVATYVDAAPDRALAFELLLQRLREWRDDLIPKTSTSGARAMQNLLRALEQYECPHPRAQRVFDPAGSRSCGRCGATIVSEEPTPEPEDA